MDTYRPATPSSEQAAQPFPAALPAQTRRPTHPPRSPMDHDPVVGGNTAFAIDLYHRLCGAEDNLFLSPYSISTALAMTYAGARATTETQMARVLRFALPQDELHAAFAELEAHFDKVQQPGDIALLVANSLWPQVGYPFLDAFLDLCQRCYGVSITPVDYASDPEAARKTINAWVENKTRNKIQELLQPRNVGSDTTLALVNAIYFKGAWLNPFDPEQTVEGPFWLSPGKSVTVPMMQQRERFGYAEVDGVQILDMPYAGNDLSMIVLLPALDVGVTRLEEPLTLETLAKWTSYLDWMKVQVHLPRFKITGRFDLGDTLMAMGMPGAFYYGAADFSGMTGARDLFISKVVHKAFVEVNEQGTEAAAATAVTMGRGFGGPVPVFEADRPFLFLIRDRASGSILFLGRVVDPTAAE